MEAAQASDVVREEAGSLSRVTRWQDPTPHIEAGMRMSGLDYMKALLTGDLPLSPIAVTMGIKGVGAEEGRVVMTLDPGEYHYNPIGSVHGGALATLLDSVMACAAHTTLPAGVGYSTVELKVTYLRPVTVQTGQVTGTGTVLQAGKRIIAVEGEARDAEGRLLAHATSSCLVIRP